LLKRGLVTFAFMALGAQLNCCKEIIKEKSEKFRLLLISVPKL